MIIVERVLNMNNKIYRTKSTSNSDSHSDTSENYK